MSALVLIGGDHACRVERGRIAWIGRADEARAHAARDDRTVDHPGADLQGAFIDHHLHLAWLGRELASTSVRDAPSIDDALRTVSAALGAAGDGWLRVEGWRPLTHVADRARIDALTGDRPVVFEALDGHSVWANGAALAAAGITRETSDPPGGAIDRDVTGRPTGVLREMAVEMLSPAEPSATPATLRRHMRAAQDALLAEGVTRVHVMEGRATYETLAALDRAGEWLIGTDVFVPVDDLDDTLAAARDLAALPHVRIRGVKVFLDGSLGSHTAAFRHPYADAPHDCGILRTDERALAEHLRRARALGLEAAVHGIGDRAIGVLCSVLESLGPDERPRSVRLEHAQHVAPDDVARLARLGVTASMQPLHAALDAPLVARVLADDALHTHAWRTLARAGVPLLFGSDAPVAMPHALAAVAGAGDAAAPERLARSDALAAHGVQPLCVGDPAHVVLTQDGRIVCTVVGDHVAPVAVETAP